jgi:hypothetical protein
VGFLDRLLIEALAEHRGSDEVQRYLPQRVPIRDFGEGEVRVVVGDVTGDETPGIQIELSHEFLKHDAAMAMSAREAESLIRKLQRAVDVIAPHERVKQQQRRRR